MSDLFYIGLSFTTFSAIVLLSHVGIAYPVFSEGVRALFTIAFALDAVFGLCCLALALSNRRIYQRRYGWFRPLAPAIVIALILVIAISVGIWVGG